MKTLPRSLVKREEESPCSTSLLMAIASSRLLHFNTYTIGANVSLNKKKEIGCKLIFCKPFEDWTASKWLCATSNNGWFYV